jgi:alpha-L-rhamnosidase
MPIIRLLFARAVILSLSWWAFAALAGVEVTGLQCEYLTDPLGIDVITPRFNWKILDAHHTRGQKQTGYQVLVAGSRKLLDSGRADIWDSGQTHSDQSALVLFAGKKLVSGEECFWKVRVWDMNQQPSDWSAPARFTMGLLKPGDWTGPWIKHPTAPEEKHIWFRRCLTLDQKPSAALIQVASVGYHELYVNGRKADARVLAPSLTRLDKRPTKN